MKKIVSKEFITKEYPKGNHVFLISFLIPLTLIYDYIVMKGLIKEDMKDSDYSVLYNAIVKGMKNAEFGDFGGVSSTSYKVQSNCFEKMKECIDELL